MLLRLSVGLVLLLCAFPSISNPQALSPVSKDKLDRLIVYGDGFAFGVKEPSGWLGDTVDLARKYHVNVLFAPVKQDGSNDITIRVRLNKKVDENTIEDLNYDMEQYKRDYPKTKFDGLSIQHPEYKTFTKLVYVPDQFYEYIAYVNPGPMSKFTFSAAMSKRVKPATPEELKAFESVLRSLIWLSGLTLQK